MLTVIPEQYDEENRVVELPVGEKKICFRARDAQFVNPPADIKFVTVYIHGDAESAAGFDIPVYKSGTMDLSKDVQPVLLEVPAGHVIACSLFLWRAYKGVPDSKGFRSAMPLDDRLCGLIVATTDEDSLSYARRCLRVKDF